MFWRTILLTSSRLKDRPRQLTARTTQFVGCEAAKMEADIPSKHW
jgi:hypothetical protein